MWIVEDCNLTIKSGAHAAACVRERLKNKCYETCFTHATSQHSIVCITNGERAMVCLFSDDEYDGYHLVSPSAVGTSEGFVLANGQHDSYPDGDTVVLDQALNELAFIIDGQVPGPNWQP